MISRFFTFAFVASLLMFGLFSVVVNKVFADDDLWYPGEGVKTDMFVEYKIQELDTANGDPFTMTMWFEDQQEGNWIVPTSVQHGNDVMTGTLKLTDGMYPLAGDDQVPPGMIDFLDGYKSSLHWLDAYTPKAKPLSLKSSSWGKIAGGPEIKPSGEEKVSFQGAQSLCKADSCGATLIMWHKGVDNKIWIVNEFPFPVKADTFAEDASGSTVTQFKYELLQVGTGKPPVLIGSGEPEKQPVQRRTHSGYYMNLTWSPEEIPPNKDVLLGIEMYDQHKSPLLDVEYNLDVKDSKGDVLAQFTNQKAELGSATHHIKFNGTGTMVISVTITAIKGQTTGQFVENADFGIVVVPEFPTSSVIVAAGIIGVLIALTRARGILKDGPSGSESPQDP